MGEILVKLEETKHLTLNYYDLPSSSLTRSYAPGKWSVKKILHHLVNAETVLYDRIRRTIAEPGSVIWAFDQDKWCDKMEYENQPFFVSKAIFSAIRDGVINLAAQYYEKYGANQFIHSQTGLRTLKQEFDKVVWHNEQHLVQIHEALKNIKSSNGYGIPDLNR